MSEQNNENKNEALRISKFEANRGKYAAKYSKAYCQSFFRNILTPISETWFRPELIGFENFPKRTNPDAPLIFFSNHSGNGFPWDAIVYISKINSMNLAENESVRALISTDLTRYLCLNPFLVDDIWVKCGCINATPLNFETVMHLNEYNVMIYPEGINGIGKGSNKAYQIQPLQLSFLRMALKYKTDIVPFMTINAEYNCPLTITPKWLVKLARKLGLPFLPLGPIHICSFIFAPWLVYATAPAQINFIMGKPVKLSELVNKPYEELKKEELLELSEKIRASLEQQIKEANEVYGKKHYNIPTLLKAMRKNWKKFFIWWPPFWPFAITYFDVNYDEKVGDASIKFSLWKLIKTLFKRPRVISLFIPVWGWIVMIGKTIWQVKVLKKK